jgi:hypothetical protein
VGQLRVEISHACQQLQTDSPTILQEDHAQGLRPQVIPLAYYPSTLLTSMFMFQCRNRNFQLHYLRM